MQWTDQKVYKHIEKHNGPEIVILVKKFLGTLKDDELYRFGKGINFPSIKLFNKKLSEDHQIIGIEFFRLGTSEVDFHYWINFKYYEDIDKSMIIKIREFLGEYKKKYPPVYAESPSTLLDEIREILQIIHDHFHPVSA